MATSKSKINWLFRASLEVAEIHDYITEVRSELSADKFVDELFERVSILENHPEFGHPSRISKLQKEGVRRLNFKKYIIFYRVKKKVEILSVMHSSRNPKDFEDIV